LLERLISNLKDGRSNFLVVVVISLRENLCYNQVRLYSQRETFVVLTLQHVYCQHLSIRAELELALINVNEKHIN